MADTSGTPVPQQKMSPDPSADHQRADSFAEFEESKRASRALVDELRAEVECLQQCVLHNGNTGIMIEYLRTQLAKLEADKKEREQSERDSRSRLEVQLQELQQKLDEQKALFEQASKEQTARADAAKTGQKAEAKAALTEAVLQRERLTRLHERYELIKERDEGALREGNCGRVHSQQELNDHMLKEREITVASKEKVLDETREALLKDEVAWKGTAPRSWTVSTTTARCTS
jgi:multidrug efflux pump subunit AcrA (membrane-fusion protein)